MAPDLIGVEFECPVAGWPRAQATFNSLHPSGDRRVDPASRSAGVRLEALSWGGCSHDHATARPVLRRIRVASKAELKQRILAYLDDINREPVVHTWSYRITLPA